MIHSKNIIRQIKCNSYDWARTYFASVHLFCVHVSDGLIQEADISPDEAAVVWMWDVSSLGLPRCSCVDVGCFVSRAPAALLLDICGSGDL